MRKDNGSERASVQVMVETAIACVLLVMCIFGDVIAHADALRGCVQ